MPQNLEEKARNALKMVAIHGIAQVIASPDGRDALQYGRDHNLFDQHDVNNADGQYREKVARMAFDAIPLWGIDRVRFCFGEHLAYGLQNGVFNDEAVDEAQAQYRDNAARDALNMVSMQGLPYVRKWHEAHLHHGISKGIFSSADVNAAQIKYVDKMEKVAKLPPLPLNY